jgi:hypothetical protein
MHGKSTLHHPSADPPSLRLPGEPDGATEWGPQFLAYEPDCPQCHGYNISSSQSQGRRRATAQGGFLILHAHGIIGEAKSFR